MNKNKKRTHSSQHRPNDFKEFEVYHECELLPFLIEKMPGLSRNNVKSILSHHQVAVDGAPISQYDFKLYKEDTVIVSKRKIGKRKDESIPIIYEDEEFIVVDKPSGLLSIASDREKGKTVYRILTDYVQSKDRHNRIFVVHRLDEDTSGVLVVAKNGKLRDAMQDNWQEIVKSRGYYAIVDGKMKNNEETLSDYLKENKNNMMYISDDKKNGKLCITHYKVMNENNDHSLLEIHIDSGRKNQIRVQLGHIGHFVIGDDKYGEPTNPLNRLGLHAYELVFIHPFSKKKYEFRAKMPQEFKKMFPQKNVK
ncbi:MAG: RluA family pseudouridine synthase [Bacilli bacterium]|jgi:23S rRNA pseudouridine1911/1915/1917 synthase